MKGYSLTTHTVTTRGVVAEEFGGLGGTCAAWTRLFRRATDVLVPKKMWRKTYGAGRSQEDAGDQEAD